MRVTLILEEVMIINTILAIQVNIFMVILLFCIAVHACFALNRKNQADRFFFTLILLTIFILILEILSVVLNSREYIDFIIIQKVVDTLGFSLAPAVPVVAALYAYKRTNKDKEILINSVPWLMVPFIVNGFLSLGSYHFHWIFSITEDNLYVRGPLFLVSPLTSYFYYIVHLLVVYANRKKIGKNEMIVLGCLTFLPAILSIFQLYYFVYLTIWNSVAIAVVMNYIFIVHSQAKQDPLTGLGNRMAYDEYLAGFNGKNKGTLSVVSIDMDDFKNINDVYGHEEGDKVLRFFAKQLEDVFAGIGVAHRVGGDEFIVLLHEKQRRRIEKYIQLLHSKIDIYNMSGNVPYRIQFSYGMAIFDGSYNNVHEFIRHSDKLMYEKKQQKKY